MSLISLCPDYGGGGVFHTQLRWPRSVWISLVLTCQTRTVESVPAQTSTQLSLGWNATLCTTPVESGRFTSSCPALASQILMLRSILPVARYRPSRLNATQRTPLVWPRSFWTVLRSTDSVPHLRALLTRAGSTSAMWRISWTSPPGRRLPVTTVRPVGHPTGSPRPPSGP